MLTTPCKAATVDMFLNQVWINQSDIVLIGLRDYQVCAIDCFNASVWICGTQSLLLSLCTSWQPWFQDAKADVILKYSADEARNLKSYGEFPESVKINETVEFGGEGDDDIEFDDVDSDGSGDDSGDDIDGIWSIRSKWDLSGSAGCQDWPMNI